ncbi:NAD-dependent epimerase/dehydratase family protein [Piscinibacter sp.]|uniref:NAD-dependent epimerase/dehydratase family protein n=1 Tax=Piscinibacter sp. TaxID=1903157 RepID=UPI002CC7CFCE|nr:NAD-dependent epimerase/dehydratase family protein [Albitalea sp.]HUG26042.1 NAD-dependent epimerase/dehydratase family protein [Albitalea sp.]
MDILVTGANGHLGYNLVAELLAAGHTLRAGLRSLRERDKRERLEALGRVRVVETDLDQPQRLAAAMEGVDVLCHAAAVYSICEPRREQELWRASTSGLAGTLRAAAQARVRKVVLTSSMVTVPLTAPGAAPSTEAEWNDDLRVPYLRAKTEGERRAWALADELELPLVTVLPGAIGGPGFVRNTPTLDLLETMMRGGFRAGVPRFNLPYVDVRDVAAAHRLAAERAVGGRFIVVNDEQPDFRALIEAMNRLDPQVKLPLATLPDWALGAVPLFDRLNAWSLGTPRTVSAALVATMRGKRYNASNRRARDELDWAPRISLERSLADTMEALRRRGPRAGERSPAGSAAAAAPGR